MTNTQNDNEFLYYCQEGKLKTLQLLVDNGYKPSEETLHKALYFVLNGNYKKCYHYIFNIFKDNNYSINLYYDNALVFNRALLNEGIGIHLLNNTYFEKNHNENFQIHFLNLLQETKSAFQLEKLFTVLLTTGYTTFLEEKLRNTILGKDDHIALRKRILNIFRVLHIVEEF